MNDPGSMARLATSHVVVSAAFLCICAWAAEADAQFMSQGWSDVHPQAGASADDKFGLRNGSAGDVNGDGFDDVIIGAPSTENPGQAFLYHGSSTGLSASHDWMAGNTGSHTSGFGAALAGLGDVNGDGFDDVVVADSSAGIVRVYHGSGAGLDLEPAWTKQEANSPAFFGFTVGPAGDVNADGFDDLVISATSAAGPYCSQGRVFVYYGSDDGLSAQADWEVGSSNHGDCLGYSVAGGGDIDADGYDDLVIGAPGVADNSSAYPNHSGRVFIFRGRDHGLERQPSWQLDSMLHNLDSAYFGVQLAYAGDVDADGHADLLVRMNRAVNGTEERHLVIAYLGSPTGPELPPIWSVGEFYITQSAYGFASAGDINGDGYDDVVFGSQFPAKATLFHGSAEGLLKPHAWSEQRALQSQFGESAVGAGDVNGDGYDDIIVGAIMDGPNQSGAAYLFNGAPNPAPRAQDDSVSVDYQMSADIELEASDPHGDQVLYRIFAEPEHGSLGELSGLSGEVTYLPNRGYHGPDYFEFEAFDNYGGSDVGRVDITVERPNDQPHFVEPTPEGRLMARVGEEVAFRIAAVDPHGDALTYDVDPLADGAEIDAETGEFRWMPQRAMERVVILAAEDDEARIERELVVEVRARQGGPDSGSDAGSDVGPDADTDSSDDANLDSGPTPGPETGAESASSRTNQSGCGCASTSAATMDVSVVMWLFALFAVRRTKRRC